MESRKGRQEVVGAARTGGTLLYCPYTYGPKPRQIFTSISGMPKAGGLWSCSLSLMLFILDDDGNDDPFPVQALPPRPPADLDKSESGALARKRQPRLAARLGFPAPGPTALMTCGYAA